MPRRRRTAKHRQGDGAIRTFLLHPVPADYFGDAERLGGLKVVREYWGQHAEDLLAEFATLHVHDDRCPLRDRDDGQCRPRGWHQFDPASSRYEEGDVEPDEPWRSAPRPTR